MVNERTRVLEGGRGERNAALSSAVQLPFQYRRAFECDDAPCIEDQLIAPRRISPPAFTLVFDTELSKPADQNILSLCQTLFHDFKSIFYQLRGSLFGESIFVGNDFCKAIFVQAHDGPLHLVVCSSKTAITIYFRMPTFF